VLCGLFLCAVIPPFAEAQGRSPQKGNSGGAAAAVGGKKDACTLLTGAEIEAVQGDPVRESKTSVQLNGEMRVTECLFHTATSTKSVSVALAAPSSAKPTALTPRKFWLKQFHAPEMEEEEIRAAGASGRKTGPEREEEASKPRRIEGLGEEAYWVGTPITGALYVLEADNFVRISVGGVQEESLRIEKSKALARAVVKRLHSHPYRSALGE
jgi:hypothetical protein